MWVRWFGRAAVRKKTECWDFWSAGTKLQLLSAREPLSFLPRKQSNHTHCLQRYLRFVSKAAVTRWLIFFSSFLTHQVDCKVIKTSSMTRNFSCVTNGGKIKEPKVGKTVHPKAQAFGCSLWESGACEQAEQSTLVRQWGIKALIPFQFLPPLLTSWRIIDIPHCVKAEYPRWHNQLAYSERREIVPREDVR